MSRRDSNPRLCCSKAHVLCADSMPAQTEASAGKQTLVLALKNVITSSWLPVSPTGPIRFSVLGWVPSKAEPWVKDIGESSLLGRWSQEALVGEWGSEMGKGRNLVKCMLISKLLLWEPGLSPTRELWETPQSTLQKRRGSWGNVSTIAVYNWLGGWSWEGMVNSPALPSGFLRPEKALPKEKQVLMVRKDLGLLKMILCYIGTK